jgi:IS1 family transposase
VTVLRLLADAGTFAAQLHDRYVRNLETKRIQCDEIWSFVHCKDKNIPEHLAGIIGVGDVWVWTCIDADSKLMIDWRVGERDSWNANLLMRAVAHRIAGRVQVSTDGFRCYPNAIGNAFDVEVRSDYATCVKQYEDSGEGKYSSGRCTGIDITTKWGDPDPDHISTSYVERQNLTIRMSNRRFTRLTNGFSKKIENHNHAVALHFFHYNFIRRHQSIKTTPAQMAGVADKAWTMIDFVNAMVNEELLTGGRLTDYKPSRANTNPN